MGVSAEPSVDGPLFTVLLCELLGVLHELRPVFAVFLGQVGPQRVVGLRGAHQVDETLDHLLGSRGRLPVLDADDGQAHLALLVHIGVVDFCLEGDLGGLEGVLGGEDELDPKRSFVVRRTIRDDEALPVQDIRLIHLDAAESLWPSFADFFELLL